MTIVFAVTFRRQKYSESILIFYRVCVGAAGVSGKGRDGQGGGVMAGMRLLFSFLFVRRERKKSEKKV